MFSDAIEMTERQSERRLPSRQAIKAQLDAGKLGKVGLVRVHRWESAGTQKQPSWLLDLDLVLWLVGQPVELVYVTGVEGGYLQVHLGFAAGAMALVVSAPVLPPGDGYVSLTVVGSQGAAYADEHANQQLLFTGGVARAIRAHEGDSHLETGRPASDSGGADDDASDAAWREVLAIAAAARQSLVTRQAVRLGEPSL